MVRYDELKRGMVEHAVRVTIRKTRPEFVAPATHYASPHTNPEYPRMGRRIRLKADYDISAGGPDDSPESALPFEQIDSDNRRGCAATGG